MCPGKRGCCVCDNELYPTNGSGDYRLHWWKAQPSLRQSLTGPSNQNSTFWPRWINLQTRTHARSLKQYWWRNRILTNRPGKKPSWKWLFCKCNQSTTRRKCVCTDLFVTQCENAFIDSWDSSPRYSNTKGILLRWRCDGSYFPGYSGAVNDG